MPKTTTRYEILFPIERDISDSPTSSVLDDLNEALHVLFGPDVDIDWRDGQTVWITTDSQIWPTTVQ